MKPLLTVALAVALITLGAQLRVPAPEALGGAPITGQTLALLTLAAILRRPLGVWAAVAYVALGAAGVPLYASGRGGWQVALGGSGGYLAGFVLGAFVVQRLSARTGPVTLVRALAVQVAGTLVVLVCGALRLLEWHEPLAAARVGVAPYLAGGALKALIGALVVVAAGAARAAQERRRTAAHALSGQGDATA